MDWLTKGLAESIKLANRANTKAGYYYALSYYARGFHNGHIFIDIGKVPYLYAGLLLRYENGKYVVQKRDERYRLLPPLNSVLLSCDGRSVQEIIDRDIIPYRYTPNLEASYSKVARDMFFDANPFRVYANECKFEVEGKEKTFPIYWQKISSAGYPSIMKNLRSMRKLSTKKFGKNGLWITIPTFFPDTKQSVVFEKIIATASSYRNYNPIVLDVRGNGGGNSSWGTRLLFALYGKSFIYHITSQKNDGFNVFRVSKENIDRISWIVRLYPEQKPVLLQMQKAKAAGDTLVTIIDCEDDNKQKNNLTTQESSLFSNQLYYLTDYVCFSACLNVADDVFSLPNTTHIGLPTDADSAYTVNNNVVLAGGANFEYNMAVQRGRIRGENVPYIPKYRYNGDINDTAKLMQWVQTIADDNAKNLK